MKNNPNVFFTKPNKSNMTVCMEKKEYVSRMEDLLNDKVTYEKLNKNLLGVFETNLKNILYRFEKDTYSIFEGWPALPANLTYFSATTSS